LLFLVKGWDIACGWSPDPLWDNYRPGWAIMSMATVTASNNTSF
jgi:hypothetical protein